MEWGNRRNGTKAFICDHLRVKGLAESVNEDCAWVCRRGQEELLCIYDERETAQKCALFPLHLETATFVVT